jgi:hypothetical protein
MKWLQKASCFLFLSVSTQLENSRVPFQFCSVRSVSTKQQVRCLSGDTDNLFYGIRDTYRFLVEKPNEKLGVIRVTAFGKILIKQAFF